MALDGQTVYMGAPEPKKENLQVMSSAAGWYLGFMEDGMPYSRETVYLQTEQDARQLLVAMNNAIANNDKDMVEHFIIRYWRF